MSKIVSFLVFSCPHVPLHDKQAVDWMLAQIAANKPDYVFHAGDGHEADSASRWPSEYTWDLAHEFKLHNALLKDVREAAGPKAKLIYIPGNHDVNIQAIGRINPKLRSLCRVEDHEPELQHWDTSTIYEYSASGVYRLGQLSVGHGWESGHTADSNQALLLGLPYGLSVFGHTHRPAPVTECTKGNIPLKHWYANAGTLRDIWNVPYMERQRRVLWGQAVVVGEVMLDPSNVYTTNWSAETIVYRKFNDGKEDLP